MRPNAAHRLHHDPEVQALIDELRAEAFVDFERTPIDNVDQMLRIRMRLQIIDDFRSRIASRASDHS